MLLEDITFSKSRQNNWPLAVKVLAASYRNMMWGFSLTGDQSPETWITLDELQRAIIALIFFTCLSIGLGGVDNDWSFSGPNQWLGTKHSNWEVTAGVYSDVNSGCNHVFSSLCYQWDLRFFQTHPPTHTQCIHCKTLHNKQCKLCFMLMLI